ncbi:MAG TPA: AlkA N-terminal domain-containing protein, partial [Candidatus Saccharimonadales bacterium]|nr:AlkA N-terminal domain-containing protein [Candidatus Saccharimonadales bacterium]
MRSSAAPIERRLAFTPPLDWDSLVSFIAMRAIPGVESVEEGAYRRTVRFGRREGTLRISRDGDRALRLVVDRRLRPDIEEIVRRARRLFDLDADPERIARHLRRDRDLAPIVRRLPGLRVPGAFDGFETSIRAILGQQVSVKGATTLSGRLVAGFGRPMAGGTGALTHHFPEPAALAGAAIAGIGLPAARAGAIRALAAAVRDKSISLDAAPD